MQCIWRCCAGGGTTPPSLLDWGSTQGYILTGGGKLNDVFTPGKHFSTDGTELPHYLKAQGIDAGRKMYRKWLGEHKQSDLCKGAWSRPLFAGTHNT